MTNFWCFFIKIIFISISALLFSDTWTYIYNRMYSLPQTNWSDVDLLVTRLAHGRIYKNTRNTTLLKPHAYLLGLIEHYIIAIIFTIAYIFVVHYLLKTTPDVLNGLLFGLFLAFFPLFIELPIMEKSLLNAHTSLVVLLRVISCHALFGIGLGVGGLLIRTSMA